MTSENYISYLIGTANGYPSKTQRYLKTLFSAAGIAVPDDQISITFDVDTTVNHTNCVFQVCMNLQSPAPLGRK